MLRSSSSLCGVVALCAAALVSQAAVASDVVVATTADFDPVQLRVANNGTDGHGTISTTTVEGQPGFYAHTFSAGQKVYAGTENLDGIRVGNVQTISFSYAFRDDLTPAEKTTAQSNWPYNNFIVTDGQGSWGMIAATTGSTTPLGTISYNSLDWQAYQVDVSFNMSSLKMYEQVGSEAFGTHGHTLTPSEVNELMSDWMIASGRPLSAGEGGVPRGPQDHGFSISWGDSASNYLGERLIYDISISATPVPSPSAALGGVALFGLTALRRRRTA